MHGDGNVCDKAIKMLANAWTKLLDMSNDALGEVIGIRFITGIYFCVLVLDEARRH